MKIKQTFCSENFSNKKRQTNCAAKATITPCDFNLVSCPYLDLSSLRVLMLN